MKSVRLQLLVTLLAAAVAAGFFIHRGPLPTTSWTDAIYAVDAEALKRNLRWGVDPNALYPMDDIGPSYPEKRMGTLLHSLVLDRPLYGGDWMDASEHENRMRVGIARLLLQYGADPDALDSEGMRPAHLAVQRADPAMVRLLVEKGTNVDAYSTNGGWRGTLLHYLADLPLDLEVVRLAMARSRHIDAPDSDGGTPLHWAARHADRHFAKLAIRAGADVNRRDDEGQTPLHWAAQPRREETMEILIEAGADLSVRDKQGRTPLMLAVERGYMNIAGFLRQHGARE